MTVLDALGLDRLAGPTRASASTSDRRRGGSFPPHASPRVVGLSRITKKERPEMRIDLNVDLDDVEVSATLAKVGGGNYSSWHMQFRFGGSEIVFDASSSEDIERILDSLQHDLMLLKALAS